MPSVCENVCLFACKYRYTYVLHTHTHTHTLTDSLSHLAHTSAHTHTNQTTQKPLYYIFAVVAYMLMYMCIRERGL